MILITCLGTRDPIRVLKEPCLVYKDDEYTDSDPYINQ